MGIHRDTLLLVDDHEINRAALRSIFEGAYNVLEAENGEQAMVLIGQYHDRLAAMLLDIMMPVMDGYQVMEKAGKLGYLREIPVVVITAESSAENEVRVFDMGASDIIAKPFEPHVVLRRVQNIVDLNLRKLHQDELIEQQASKLRESNSIMIEALSSIIEYRSLETGRHIQRIGLFTKTLLEDAAKNYPEYLLDDHKVSVIASAASLHDIGKIAIPDAILNKPGRLTQEEYEVMKTHAAKGSEMLTSLNGMSDQEYLRYAYNICRYHHERWDGSGYPDGLKGDAIPICAQVVGIADCYDALTNDRVYKKAIPSNQAINMILNGECGIFSPRLLESLKNVEGTLSHLTAEHIDAGAGQAASSALPPPTHKEREADALDTQQMAQMKYLTLLRQLDSTVMEVDFNTGLYHVVYLAGDGFDSLRSGTTFEEAYRNFVNSSVHPDDRAAVLQALEGYISELFNEGLMKRSRRYRVFCEDLQSYVWFRATLLRIDTENPRQRRALILWRREEGGTSRRHLGEMDQASHRLLRSAIGSVQRCRLDHQLTLAPPLEWLQSFLGYSAEELQNLFGNSYINLVYPADRAGVMRQIQQQLRRGDMVEQEYRMTAKDGSLIWVLDKSICLTDSKGEQYLYYVLIDITQTRRTLQELRLLSERYRVLLEETNDIIFEWNSRRDLLDMSASWKKKFGYAAVREKASERLLRASHIHPGDAPQISRLLEDLRAERNPIREMDLRIADSEGRYLWYRVRMVTERGDDGSLLSIIGILSNIDTEKKAVEALRSEADHDYLTSLYNRKAAVRHVENFISEMDDSQKKGAMLLLDLDGFKQINDRHGHLYGDEILKRAAMELQRAIYPGELASRVGGDEFLLFLWDVPDRAPVLKRAGEIAAALRSAFEEMAPENPLSCSVGVSFCPKDGMCFNDLFGHSDTALYHAKSQGKDRIERYDASS